VSSNPALIAGMVVVGVGMGFSTAPLQTAALEAVSPAVAGSATGVLSTSRYLGSITGSLAIAALVGDSTDGARTVLALTAIAAIVATVSATQFAAMPLGRQHFRTGVG
jgi:sugar phosphate permease